MLVLERRLGQAVLLTLNGESLTLTIESVRGNHGNERVKLGFEGPEHFRVIRLELDSEPTLDEARKLLHDRGILKTEE